METQAPVTILPRSHLLAYWWLGKQAGTGVCGAGEATTRIWAWDAPVSEKRRAKPQQQSSQSECPPLLRTTQSGLSDDGLMA